jgi:hypothetical protein
MWLQGAVRISVFGNYLCEFHELFSCLYFGKMVRYEGNSLGHVTMQFLTSTLRAIIHSGGAIEIQIIVLQRVPNTQQSFHIGWV